MVFSSSFISSPRSNFSACWMIFAGTDCLRFYKEKKHIRLNVCFAWSQWTIFFHPGGWVRNQNTTQVNSKVNSCKPQPTLTNILMSKSGFGFSIAMRTWPLLLAISDSSSSNTTSGTRFCPAVSGRSIWTPETLSPSTTFFLPFDFGEADFGLPADGACPCPCPHASPAPAIRARIAASSSTFSSSSSMLASSLTAKSIKRRSTSD